MRDTNVTQLKKDNRFKGIFSSFTKKYSLNKTVRFELRPLPETKKFLSEFITSDTKRSEDYQKLKKIIDDYHKDYIEKSLFSENILNNDDLRKAAELLSESKNIKLYTEKEKIKRKLEDLQKKLRTQIANCFADKKELFGKELITKILPLWLNKGSKEDVEDKKQIVESFNKFTTYLKGFYENRQNIYSDKEQSTAISHRLINENFPRFSSNINAYEKILKSFPELYQELENIKSELKEEFEYFKIDNIKSLFEINFFNKCLTQAEIDNYNFIIGGKTLGNGKKIKGINERINLYRQKKKQEQQKKVSNRNLPLMQILHKQILSDSHSHSFYFSEEFKDRKDVLESIHEFWKVIFEKRDNEGLNVLQRIETLFVNISNYELDKIYFKKSELPRVSNKLFKNYKIFQSALRYYSEKEFSNKKEKEQWLKRDFYSFEEIHEALSVYSKEESCGIEASEKNILISYFKLEFQNKTDAGNKGEKAFSLLSDIERFYKNVQRIQDSSQYEFDKTETEVIQSFLSYLMDLLHLIKPVCLKKNGMEIEDIDKDTNFYEEFKVLYEELFLIVKLYNKSRNYIAKNKNHLKKIKINFEDGTLLNGWDVNKESDNLAVILRRKEKGRWIYYLGIMNKKHRKVFDYHTSANDSKQALQKKEVLRNKIMAEGVEDHYEKMNYKQISDAGKDIQTLLKINDKVCRKTKNLEELRKKHLPSEIWKIKQNGSYKGDAKVKEDLKTFIDYYKNIAKQYWKQFNLSFKNSEKYKDFKDFTDDINSQGYKLSFDKIKVSYIEEKTKTGELYLFKIYSKDFSEHSKGTGKPNLHTSYFRMLFEKENLEDTVFKMNGEAEIFYRKASFKKKVTHKKNEIIKNKNNLNPNKTSRFPYDLIKNKRFTEDKYFFHLPITLNFKRRGMKPFEFNQEVLKFIQVNQSINIIGIDRGERHLAYYTIVNQKGDILKQGSFNRISNTYKKNGQTIPVETNYHKLLSEREEERDKARKSWTTIENIKDIKEGYLSHLVHQISRLMVEYNAIVVLEDLNFGFKRGRMKFEKQVYQKLEKALIDKLNYLVFKDIQNHQESGGYLNAYQLTAPFESFKKLGRQTGFVFYTPAHYTSKICPLTGFVNLIYPEYKNVEKAKEFFKRFERIYFNSEKNYFVFEYKEEKVNSSRQSESDFFWRICTHGSDRYKYDRMNEIHKKVDVTQELKTLFDECGISYEENKDIIESVVKQNQRKFFEELINLLRLTLQLRYDNLEAKTEDEKDFILSPVADESGRFFDSRKARCNEPQNADANGAYHIALKGLKTLQDLSASQGRIKVQPIKNKDWFDFVRKRIIIQSQKAG